jgi:hypothetical protein
MQIGCVHHREAYMPDYVLQRFGKRDATAPCLCFPPLQHCFEEIYLADIQVIAFEELNQLSLRNTPEGILSNIPRRFNRRSQQDLCVLLHIPYAQVSQRTNFVLIGYEHYSNHRLCVELDDASINELEHHPKTARGHV